MMRFRAWLGILVLAGFIGSLAAKGYAASQTDFALAAGTISLQNDFIRVYVGEQGMFTVGTRLGDPQTSADDEKVLLFGHGRDHWTSFTSVRFVRDGSTQDVALSQLRPDQPPVTSGDSVATVWTTSDVEIRQVLTLASNPFTGRADTVMIATSTANKGNRALDVGIRVMLDTMIGANDYAPFFIPGTGNTDEEHEYSGAAVPLYWKAFEARDYSPSSLKGQGIMTGFGATPPDRFVVANWPRISRTIWDYRVTPGMKVGDSAVALYWMPKELQPGESVTWTTYYGLAGAGGGKAWFDAPVRVTSENPRFQATLWVSNDSDSDFTGGEALLALTPGLALASEETLRKPFPLVPTGGGAQSVSWQLVASGNVDTHYPYSATITFAAGSPQLVAKNSVFYQKVVLPVPTPCPTSLLPFVRDRCWLWWPWLLLLVPLLGLLLWRMLHRKPRRLPPPPPPRPVVKPLPPQTGWSAGSQARTPEGQDVIHDKPGSATGIHPSKPSKSQ